jgi:hypothetical protein
MRYELIVKSTPEAAFSESVARGFVVCGEIEESGSFSRVLVESRPSLTLAETRLADWALSERDDRLMKWNALFIPAEPLFFDDLRVASFLLDKE